MDPTAIISDLLRVSTIALFAGAAYYVKELAREVKDIRTVVGNHGERISKIEGAHEKQARQANGLQPG